jgi:hypothetical protein
MRWHAQQEGVEIAVRTSSSEPILQPALPLFAQAAAAALPKKRQRKHGRISIRIPELELAIAEAVKKAGPGCEDFIGVVVQPATLRSRLEVSWELKGVKLGKADRAAVNEALTSIVERMQKEFWLAED